MVETIKFFDAEGNQFDTGILPGNDPDFDPLHREPSDIMRDITYIESIIDKPESRGKRSALNSAHRKLATEWKRATKYKRAMGH